MMKKISTLCFGVLVSMSLLVSIPASLTASAQDVLTNDSIVKMVKSGLGESLIVSIVQNHPGNYSLTPDDMVKLKESGVSEKILTAMVNKGPDGRSSFRSVKIESKTPVRLIIENTISSKTAKAGETLNLVVAEDLVIDGHVVIAKGAFATGRITIAESMSFASRDGKIEVIIDSVRAIDGSNIALDGRISEGGRDVGFLQMGEDSEIKKGRVINTVIATETVVKL